MKPLSLFSLLALAGLSTCGALLTTSGNTASASLYAVTDVTIIDVKKGNAIPEQTVIIVGDQIDQISDQGRIQIPQDAAIIDGQGLYLMPGFVDAHVHYYEAPTFRRVLIANGALLVQDMGMSNEYILPLREQLNRGEILGPEMIATGSGTKFTALNRYAFEGKIEISLCSFASWQHL